jgi:Protein of unknown function (DUF3592)
MNNEPHPDSQDSPIIRFGVRFFGLLLLVISPFGIYWGITNFLEAMNSVNWPRVQGEVYDVQVWERNSRRGTSYTPYIKYRYTVAGKSYGNSRVRPGMGDVKKDSLEQLLAKYPVGSRPEVYYSPSDPSNSMLEPGQEWLDFVRLFVPLIFPVVGVLLLLGSRRSPTPRRTPDDSHESIND